MKKQIFLVLFLTLFSFSVDAQLAKKKDVTGVEGTLTLRPDSVVYKGTDGKSYYFFYDFSKKVLFVSANPQIWKDIRAHLPAHMIPGNEVRLQGAMIKAFGSLFDNTVTREEERRTGIKLKKFKIAKIFNYGLLSSGESVFKDQL